MTDSVLARSEFEAQYAEYQRITHLPLQYWLVSFYAPDRGCSEPFSDVAFEVGAPVAAVAVGLVLNSDAFEGWWGDDPHPRCAWAVPMRRPLPSSSLIMPDRKHEAQAYSDLWEHESCTEVEL